MAAAPVSAPSGSSRLGPLWVRILIAVAIVALFAAFSTEDGRDAMRHFLRLLVRNLLR